MARRIAIIKRTSLADIGIGWDNCYIDYTPATEAERLQLKDMQDEQALPFVIAKIKEHFIGGKVMTFDANNQPSEASMEVDDVSYDVLGTTLFVIFSDMNGARLDPKDIQKELEASMRRVAEERRTTTPSSTDSKSTEASPPKSTPSDTGSDSGSQASNS